MNTFTRKKCLPCSGKMPKLKPTQWKKLLRELGGGWKAVRGGRLEKEFRFEDFRQAWLFTNRIAQLAEKEYHHPDLFLAWGRVKVTIWTHAVGGLTENDFILAAKIDRIRG